MRVGLLQTAGTAAFFVLDTRGQDADAVPSLVRALDARGWMGDELLGSLMEALLPGVSGSASIWTGSRMSWAILAADS